MVPSARIALLGARPSNAFVARIGRRRARKEPTPTAYPCDTPRGRRRSRARMSADSQQNGHYSDGLLALVRGHQLRGRQRVAFGRLQDVVLLRARAEAGRRVERVEAEEVAVPLSRRRARPAIARLS